MVELCEFIGERWFFVESNGLLTIPRHRPEARSITFAMALTTSGAWSGVVWRDIECVGDPTSHLLGPIHGSSALRFSTYRVLCIRRCVGVTIHLGIVFSDLRLLISNIDKLLFLHYFQQ